MLRHSLQRTSLKSFTRVYTTTIQPSAKSIAPAVQQAQNRATTWSKDQRPKAEALVGPRFEQIDLATQVNFNRNSLVMRVTLMQTTKIAQPYGRY